MFTSEVCERSLYMNHKVLIVDGDKSCAAALKNALEKEKHEVAVSESGDLAIGAFKLFSPDAVVMESTLSAKDGLQLLREIRSFSSKPIIIVSERSDVFDKVLALEMGADDYVVKPYDPKEIIARLKAIMRRYALGHTDDETVKLDGLEISLQRYVLKLADKFVNMPPKELELLYHLVANANRVFTRDQLLDKIWGYDYIGDSRTVDVHVKRIREKISGISDKWELKTIWGVGYKFELANE